MIWGSDADPALGVGKGTAFTAEEKQLGVVIHKYFGCGDYLFLSCGDLGLMGVELHTKDFDEAIVRTKKLLMARMATLVEIVGDFCTDESESRFVKRGG